MGGGLIDPDASMPGSKHLRPVAVGQSADEMRALGRAVCARAVAVAGLWTGLIPVYQAPEQENVLGLMGPVVTAGEDVSAATGAVANALEDYAAALVPIRRDMLDLERRARAFRDRVKDGVKTNIVGDVPWYESGPGVWLAQAVTSGWKTVPWYEDHGTWQQNEDYLTEYAKLWARVSQAVATCADAVNKVAFPHLHVAPTPTFTADQVMASDNPWGSPGAEGHNCVEQAYQGEGDFFGSLLKGAGSLLGRDPSTGRWSVGEAGQAWLHLTTLGGSLMLMVTPLGAVSETLYGAQQVGNAFGVHMPDLNKDVFGDTAGGFLDYTDKTVWDVGGSLISYDPATAAAGGNGWHLWKEEPWRAVTSSVLNVGTLFLPAAGEAGAGAKGAGAGAKVGAVLSRVARVGADVVLPGASWVVRGTEAAARAAMTAARSGQWSAAVDAVRTAAAGSRGMVGADNALAQALADLDKVPAPTPAVHPDLPSVSGSIRPPGPPSPEPPTPHVDLSVPRPQVPDVGVGAGGPRAAEVPGLDEPGVGVGEVSVSRADQLPASHADVGAEPSPARADGPAVGSAAQPGLSDEQVRQGTDSWLHQDAPVEPSAAERAEGVPVFEPVREPDMATVGAERSMQADGRETPLSPGGGAGDLGGGGAAESPRGSTTTPDSTTTPGGPHAPGGSGDVPGDRSAMSSGGDAPTSAGGHDASSGGLGSSADVPTGGHEASGSVPDGPGGTGPSDGSALHPGGEDPAGAAPTRSDVPTSQVLAEYPRPVTEHTVTIGIDDVPGPRTPFVRTSADGSFVLNDGNHLAPDTCYDVAGRGRFYTDEDGTVVRVETTAGGDAGLNPDLQHPLPSTEYVVNGDTVFHTDDEARTIEMDARGLTTGDGVRSEHTQGLVGAEGRAEYPGQDYQGGHLRGAQFDGPAERLNYVPMLEDINNARSQFINPETNRNFGTLENDLATIIKDDPGAVVDLRVRPVFEGDSRVPVRIETQYRIDGGEWKIEEFDNVK